MTAAVDHGGYPATYAASTGRILAVWHRVPDPPAATPGPGTARRCTPPGGAGRMAGMTHVMVKGSNVQLDAQGVRAVLRWSPRPGSPDVDASVLLLGPDGRVR